MLSSFAPVAADHAFLGRKAFTDEVNHRRDPRGVDSLI